MSDGRAMKEFDIHFKNILSGAANDPDRMTSSMFDLEVCELAFPHKLEEYRMKKAYCLAKEKREREARENASYKKKLLDPRWQKRRLQILERDFWMCMECGCKTRTLHVHNLRYHPSGNPWESPDEDLTTFCDRCHKQAHNK